MRRLILVRHGVTAWNKEGRRLGWTDIPLDEEGMEQARRLSMRLRNEKPAGILSSDLLRARQTAYMIAKEHDMNVHYVSAMRETNHGSLEGSFRTEIDGTDIASGQGFVRPSDAEGAIDVWNRIASSLQDLFIMHPEETLILVGHMGPLRMLICQLIGLPLESRGRLLIDCASVSELRMIGGTAQLVLLNDTHHLR